MNLLFLGVESALAVALSDDQLERLLSCMGYRLEVVRRPVVPKLMRSERRSWQLHRRVSSPLNRDTIQEWRPIDRRKRGSAQRPGHRHERNLQRWRDLVDGCDLPGLHRVLTGLDRDSIEMREVSPMSGPLTQKQCSEAMVPAS